jgi:hypothetical protein
MKQKKLLPPVDWLQDRAAEILNERDEPKVVVALEQLLTYYEPLNYHLTYGSGLWRARPCNDKHGFGSFQKMHYPPASCATAGRVNDPASPLLYSSFTQLTALREVQVKSGDFVQVMAYKMDRADPVRCFTLGEFANVHLRGRGNLSEAVGENLNTILRKMKFESGLSFVFLDALLANIMSGKQAHVNEYIHSRTLARLILKKYPNIEAIHYPSVAREGAMNIAISPATADRALQFLGTSVLLIEKVFDYGLCRFRILKSATQLTEDGTFVWRATNSSLQRMALTGRR